MAEESLYTKKVIEHFRKPHNMGRIKNPDGVGKVGNLQCGDVMWLYIKVGKNKKGREIIKDIKFETYGCVAALATSSVITDMAKGKTLEEALEIKKDNVVKELGGLPPVKIHCSLLATDALCEAIYDYLTKQKRPIPEKLLKIHQRIEKEKNLVEKNYKNWVETEEKMHNETE
ncbi:MAG TPA: iron-sulfur cluster assembly scaffold protein [Candidatus Pacearchaeota archaeon]|nr:iron-sulfur cluster assembly scaffold protein [Candidatus Pacearchaeota archaeon]HOK94314.1 iron-sulfur cluster assembly scaffold protein [Candidatus Pacearchaeota archaeon]HPO75330.1 iron-sulfur cluster assembly scaffold protein [Candidatus Pacearchaeota archaeon]